MDRVARIFPPIVRLQQPRQRLARQQGRDQKPEQCEALPDHNGNCLGFVWLKPHVGVLPPSPQQKQDRQDE